MKEIKKERKIPNDTLNLLGWSSGGNCLLLSSFFFSSPHKPETSYSKMALVMLPATQSAPSPSAAAPVALMNDAVRCLATLAWKSQDGKNSAKWQSWQLQLQREASGGGGGGSASDEQAKEKLLAGDWLQTLLPCWITLGMCTSTGNSVLSASHSPNWEMEKMEGGGEWGAFQAENHPPDPPQDLFFRLPEVKIMCFY